MTYKPTAEQLEALALFSTGQSLAIEAGAGTGKTSTLVMLAQSTKRKGQYIAFNKAIVTEAGAKFPSNVNCATAHSLAHKAVGHMYASRLRNSARMKPMELAAALKTKPMTVRTYSGEEKYLGAAFLAGLTMRAVTRFCQSADAEPMAKHVPLVDGLDSPRYERFASDGYPVNDAVAKALVPAMKLAWRDLCMYEGKLPYKHDHYLKLWQLTGPKIDADFILFDEAQDSDGVMLSVLGLQRHAQILRRRPLPANL
jgi:hypothetical protein